MLQHDGANIQTDTSTNFPSKLSTDVRAFTCSVRIAYARADVRADARADAQAYAGPIIKTDVPAHGPACVAANNPTDTSTNDIAVPSRFVLLGWPIPMHGM